MKAWIFGIVAVLAGCGQTIDVGCEARAGLPLPIVVQSEGGNAPCNTHADCASSECVPLVESEPNFAGACWDAEFVGCEEVLFDQWVIDAFCGVRRLEVCQLSLSADDDARCDPPADSLAPWVANFMCCDP